MPHHSRPLVFYPYEEGFPLSFTKLPMVASDLILTGGLKGLPLKVYLALSRRCVYKTGEVHLTVTAPAIADVAGCSRQNVYPAIKVLRGLGLLVGGSGLHGTLVGFASRPYKSSADARAHSDKGDAVQDAVQTVTKKSDAQAKEDADRQLHNSVERTRRENEAAKQHMFGPAPSQNGNGTTGTRFKTAEQKEEEEFASRIADLGSRYG